MALPHSLLGLREIRKVRRIKVNEMAAIIGLQPTSYSRFERGERRMYIDQAIAIAHHLGVRIDDLTHLLDEDAALRLCDERDKAAIAAGTFNRALWAPGSVPPPPGPSSASASSVPPPPPAEQRDIVVSAPTVNASDVGAILDGWDVGS